MSAIRVLIVDDSVVIRRLLKECLSSDPDIEVCGTAPNGKIALARIPQVNPDIVTLDVEMPEMDGLETMREIRKVHKRLPVIMFSTLTERGASATLDALAAGASDYVTKPSNVGGVTAAMQRVRESLIPKIKAFCRPGIERPAAASSAGPLAKKPATSSGGRIDVVAIGCSTGGPNALAEVFSHLPGDLGVPIVMVQHMPPVFTGLLAERLSSLGPVRCKEAAEGDVLESGAAWLAPGGKHMVLRPEGGRVAVSLNEEPPENSCRPAVDPLFRSVAELYGGRTLGVILTGMGSDGLRGCQALREVGAQIVTQDEATSVVWGMPGYVTQAGLPDEVVPIQDVASTIARRVWSGRAERRGAA